MRKKKIEPPHLSGEFDNWGEQWTCEEREATAGCGGAGCTGHPAGMHLVVGCASMPLSGIMRATLKAYLQEHDYDDGDAGVNEVLQVAAMCRKFYGLPEPVEPKAKRAKKK